MVVRSTHIIKNLTASCSPKLLDTLLEVQQDFGESAYLVGGTLRDWLLGKESQDLDFAVRGSALRWVRVLREKLGGGTIVDLSGPEDETYRLVWQGEQLDFSSFRNGAETIEGDLRLRDFTVNALAAEIKEISPQAAPRLIDATGGLRDLSNGTIQHLPGAFSADPVRMLRGYRLFAQFGFSITDATHQAIRRHRHFIEKTAVERINYELQLIFDSAATSATLKEMAGDGLLRLLMPELYTGEGVTQPEFHHLDVLHHSFLALQVMEGILEEPEKFYPDHGEAIRKYISHANNRRCLKWAALMHDVGKPATKKILPEKNGRVTFYRHDEVGQTVFTSYAQRYHWSGTDCDKVRGLIGMHMHPFHLCNVLREEGISKRAALKLSHRAGDDLVGLFLLSMSDSLAGKGEKKPEKMEEELVLLFTTVWKIFTENIEPVLRGPRLLTGNDLIERFGLEPGPLLGLILKHLEAARVEGMVLGKDDALAWVEKFLEQGE